MEWVYLWKRKTIRKKQTQTTTSDDKGSMLIMHGPGPHECGQLTTQQKGKKFNGLDMWKSLIGRTIGGLEVHVLIVRFYFMLVLDTA